MARDSVLVDTLVKPARMPTPAMPVPTPNRAVPMGMPIAISEPKAKRSTTTATARPMASLLSISLAASAMPPEISAWMPASRVGSMAASTASTCSAASVCSSYCTVVKAVWPSSLTVGPAGSNGSATRVTSSPASSRSSAASISALLPGLSMGSSSSWKTTRPDAPENVGNFSLRVSMPCWDSTPGTLKSSTSSPPKEDDAPKMPAASTSQSASVRNG